MPHLLNIWPVVSGQLANSPRVLLIFDYDGTLTPLVADQEIARLPDRVRRCLAELAYKERFIIGVVSGRELAALEGLVAIPGLIYIGNHGLEMRGLGIDFVHPEASGSIELMTKVAGSLEKELKRFPKLMVHDKKLAVSVSFGNTLDSYTDEIGRAVTAALDPYISAGKIKIIRGRKVFEVSPNIDWGKSEVIKKIHEGCGDNPRVMFFGDDRDDESGFAAVQEMNGIAVCIGPPRQDTKALHQLESPAEVAQVLELLENLDS